MKILIITPHFPYSRVPHAGGKFVFNILCLLSKRHDIYLFSRVEYSELKYIKAVKELCENIEIVEFKRSSYKNPFTFFNTVISYISFGLKANRIIKSGGFDAVQIEFTEAALMIRKSGKTPMILDAHDVLAKPWQRRYDLSKNFFHKLINLIIWKLVVLTERHIAKRFDLIFTMSFQDKELLLKMDKRLNVDVLIHPTGIMELSSDDIIPEAGKILLFLGAMDREANIKSVLYFHKEILPYIRRDIPDIKFYIVGNRPPDIIRSLAVNDKNTIVTGFVERIEPYYNVADVFVSPLIIGGGIIVKNLDAMSAGRPVVTTPIGNEGIEAVPDRDILIGETPVKFAEKVIVLLKDKELWQKISRNGQKFVKERFNKDSLLETLEKGYAKIGLNIIKP